MQSANFKDFELLLFINYHCKSTSTGHWNEKGPTCVNNDKKVYTLKHIQYKYFFVEKHYHFFDDHQTSEIPTRVTITKLHNYKRSGP